MATLGCRRRRHIKLANQLGSSHSFLADISGRPRHPAFSTGRPAASAKNARRRRRARARSTRQPPRAGPDGRPGGAGARGGVDGGAPRGVPRPHGALLRQAGARRQRRAPGLPQAGAPASGGESGRGRRPAGPGRPAPARPAAARQRRRVQPVGAGSPAARGQPRAPADRHPQAPVSAIRPAASMPATAQISSLSEVSPEMPTAPSSRPSWERISTPPATGTSAAGPATWLTAATK